MADTVSQSDVTSAPCTLAKSLAPEDVRIGDYIAPLHERFDCPSFFWCGDATLEDRAETVTIQLIAREGHVPLKVKAICLPFILVKHPLRGTFALDVRRYQLARLDPVYAGLARRSLKQRKKRTRGGRRKRKANKQ